MTNQSNPTNENQNKPTAQQLTAQQPIAKTGSEQKNPANKTQDGELEETQDKAKTTTTPTGQARSQNPQGKTATTPQDQTPRSNPTPRGNV